MTRLTKLLSVALCDFQTLFVDNLCENAETQAINLSLECGFLSMSGNWGDPTFPKEC